MIRVHPQNAMFDTSVEVVVSNLIPGQKVTIQALVKYLNNNFESRAHYVADKYGNVNCTKDASVGGFYTGVHPMGLFWSLQPVTKQGRLLPRDVNQPIIYRLQLIDGHVTNNQYNVISETAAHRHLMHQDVTRTEIEVGRLRGELFMPKNLSGPVPGIIDLFGSAGGLVQHRSALFASHGFAAFSLAYFAYKDLPAGIDTPIELDYFAEAADWLCKQPNVVNDRIGIIGVSLGADIAVLAGSYIPLIKAVISINSWYMVDPMNPITYKGYQLASPHIDLTNMVIEDGVTSYRPVRLNASGSDDLSFPVQYSTPDTKFLLLASTDDCDTPSTESVRKLEERFDKFGINNQCKVIEFDDAGHLLEPPFTPHCYSSFHKSIGFVLKWGGDKYKHSEAQEKSWKIIKDFFATNIGQPTSMNPFNTHLKSSL